MHRKMKFAAKNEISQEKANWLIVSCLDKNELN